MITESEKKALQLAKKVFEHFTHDALPIAREIIAMELELRESATDTEAPDDAANPILEVTKRDEGPASGSKNNVPVSDISAIGLDDPAQPVKHLSEELEYYHEEPFPF
jgi:hypothetical protein